MAADGHLPHQRRRLRAAADIDFEFDEQSIDQGWQKLSGHALLHQERIEGVGRGRELHF